MNELDHIVNTLKWRASMARQLHGGPKFLNEARDREVAAFERAAAAVEEACRTVDHYSSAFTRAQKLLDD